MLGEHVTPTQRKSLDRSKAFRADIARRAALVERKYTPVRFVPNVPYGMPKIAPAPPRLLPRYVPPPIREADYWHLMWFNDLVFGAERDLKPRYPAIESIQCAVAEEFKVTRIDLISSRRTMDIVLPRQVAMYLCKALTIHSLPVVARHFGNRDHTTVLHSVNKIKRLMVCDMVLAERIGRIAAALG